ncbi:MAG: hypothetical protein HQ509_04490 [Candidatus Marinimicrobia bacterium]|nr:hypothetical protein [Candidatus Neomarinimicrobiota bacterium]
MKKTLYIVGIIVIASFLQSCGGDRHHSKKHDESHSTSTNTEKALDDLVLNDGQKWKMDDHTRSIFVKMSGSFLNIDHVSLEGDGLKKAGTDLQADIKLLVQGCTMTGPAHDQLHIYLTGYMPAVAALTEKGSIEDAQKVKHYLEKYTEYFE